MKGTVKNKTIIGVYYSFGLKTVSDIFKILILEMTLHTVNDLNASGF